MDVQILTGTSTYLEAAFTWGGEKTQHEASIPVPRAQLSHYLSSDDVTVHGAEQDKQSGTRMQNAPKFFKLWPLFRERGSFTGSGSRDRLGI